MTAPVGLAAVDHVQLAAPPGSEDALRAFYAHDPAGNRLEFLEPDAA
ncbi:hypothetical protein [Streptomyces cyaneofuscatus]|uniref:Glyoxalase n=1 Tax=Streptomyces cyaneofuscatus TaxID=66883 RepID=A0ABZ1EVL5_9ACTN|nr:hypothetical protein [Streptomyces cyaneofuscatus]WSB08180.1 hypothetical protein OG849_13435 [Streptomyces cyaneofuscatus]WSD48287.1 hypothetical protein OG857_21970 [Streptomyces cyaneofuscatus]WTA91693.1 hypothetical protein OG323_23130 [Streptomyces cyaneofuscatus]